MNCKRYIESKGARCGHPSAEKQFVGKQLVGTFCFPCWLEVMETLPLKVFFGWTPPRGSRLEERARRAVRAKIDELRKMWREAVDEYQGATP